MIFPISKSCHKIIETVYINNGLKISKLLRDTSVSQKIGYQHVQELVNLGVFKEETKGSLRVIKPEISNETGKLIYGLIEKERELKLVKQKPQLKEPLLKIINESANHEILSVVLFGAFNNSENDNIDILVISDTENKNILPFLQECFAKVKNAVTARIMTQNGFIKFRQTKDDLFNELFKNHVCIYNTQNFLNLMI